MSRQIISERKRRLDQSQRREQRRLNRPEPRNSAPKDVFNVFPFEQRIHAVPGCLQATALRRQEAVWRQRELASLLSLPTRSVDVLGPNLSAPEEPLGVE
jgi:hypothetical protein